MIKDVLVSVIIPTYGRADNLQRAVSSVLKQSHVNIEIIVVDDNDPSSKDRIETEAKISKFLRLDNFKYIKHSENLNGSVARNTGVKHSRGNYLAFLDDDDEFHESKVFEQLIMMVNHEIEFCYCRSEFFLKGEKYYESKYNHSGNLSYEVLCSSIEFNTSTIMVSKNCFDRAKGFNELLVRNQDYDFYLRIFQFVEVFCLDSALVKVHVDSRANQPTVYEYESIRKHFISNFSFYIDQLSKKERAQFFWLFYIDLAFYAFKNKEFLFGLKMLKFIKFNRFVILVTVRRGFRLVGKLRKYLRISR
ncbi:glycosyltransferase family 2 protein [Vibrio bathopelagicus]